MINYREEIITGMAQAIRENYPDVLFEDKQTTSNPPRFPYCVCTQTSNTVIDRHSTFNNLENAVAESYTLTVYDYDDDTVTDIQNIANDYMLERGFRRSMYQPVPNFDDMTINRTVAGWKNAALV